MWGVLVKIAFRSILAAALGLAVFGFSSPTWAQDYGSNGGLPDPEGMTAKERNDATSGAIREMQGMLSQIVTLLTKAQQEGDPDHIQCVKDKQASSRAMVDVSVMAESAMQEALSGDSPARALTEYRKVSVALTKVRQFLAEAQSCVGEEVEGGQVDVESTGDDAETDEVAVTLMSDEDWETDPPNTTPFE